jgi:hypothetical protein
MTICPLGGFFPPGVLKFNLTSSFLRKKREGRRGGEWSKKGMKA